MKIKNILLAILVISCTGVQAQQDVNQEASSILRRLSETYRQPAGIHFDIAFRYSLDNDRSKVLDSLPGKCTILGDKYYYRLDETECISGENYMIVFYKEDSLMYLAKPSPNLGINPLRSIDSLLMQKQNVSISVSEESRIQSVKLSFPAGSQQKEIEYKIDKQTGFLTSIVNIVRKDMTGEQDGKDGASAKYAVIETLFSNYRQGEIDPGIFESSRYFKKVGNEFVAVRPYQGYHIMLGNPDMK